MTRILALPALLLALAACQPVVLPVEPGGGPGTSDACGASAFQVLVGQGGSILDSARFSQPVRVIRPGDVVTMDYSAGRLNFVLDGQGRIERVYCG